MPRHFLLNPEQRIGFAVALLGGAVALGACAAAVAPGPPPSRQGPIRLCVIDPGAPAGLRSIDAVFLAESRDTAVVEDGRLRPLEAVLPKVTLALESAWMVRGEPLRIAVPDGPAVEFEPWGADRVMEAGELVYLGLVDDMPVFGAAEEWAGAAQFLEGLRARRPAAGLGDLLADQPELQDLLLAASHLFLPLSRTGCVFLAVRPPLPATTNGEEEAGFFWPIPEPSASMVIGRELLAGAEAPSSLGDVAHRFERALNEAGYFEYRYYEIPGGIAMVTRLERIHADGAPLVGDDRWNLGARRNVSLRALLAGLFRGNPGHFRIIAFIVTEDPPGPDDFESDAITLAEADRWFQSGWHALRADVAERPFTPRHQSIALIYEFHQGTIADSASIVRPSGILGRTHLERARILAGLER